MQVEYASIEESKQGNLIAGKEKKKLITILGISIISVTCLVMFSLAHNLSNQQAQKKESLSKQLTKAIEQEFQTEKAWKDTTLNFIEDDLVPDYGSYLRQVLKQQLAENGHPCNKAGETIISCGLLAAINAQRLELYPAIAGSVNVKIVYTDKSSGKVLLKRKVSQPEQINMALFRQLSFQSAKQPFAVDSDYNIYDIDNLYTALIRSTGTRLGLQGHTVPANKIRELEGILGVIRGSPGGEL